MTTVAFVGAKGAPGVTTTVCAVAAVWPDVRPVVVAECDPAGGDLAARFGLGTERGMASLVLAARAEAGRGPTSAPSLDPHVQELPGGLGVVVGPVGADAASVVDQQLALLPARSWRGVDGSADREDLVIDCGRLTPDAPGQRRILLEADLVVLVARGDASSIVNGRWAADRLADLRGDRSTTRLVLVEPVSFEPGEIADVIGLPLVGCIPHDTPAAETLCGVPSSARSLARSALITAARKVAHDCAAPAVAKGLRNAS
ncbi:MAG TPA: hypothetical protein VE991_05890 [Acidimicrobiales bacterium]|nr:hypothetical protein [Acidimicrobiales bacterium]